VVRRLGEPAALIISHASGGEGYEYERHLKEYAHLLGSDTMFVYDIKALYLHGI
jgi:hypothetical protein